MRLGLARLCLPALALAAVAGLLLDGGPAAGQQQGQPPGGGKGVPVTVATAKRQDVPVWLDGIGNVQAYNTVTIRSRVDGELMKVAFTEGQTVKAGDLLAQIDPRPFQAALDQAKAKKAQDEAQLQNAQRDLERSTDLAQRGFAPRQTLDQQRAQVDQFTAAVQGDDAAIESAQVQLGYATITAPITGRTGMRLVDQGNIVHASDQNGLVTVNQVQPISVVFTLPEQELPGINRELAKGQLTVVATDRDSKEELDHGKLTLVDNQIDPSTGTIRLKATFDNPQGSLWPGQFVNVRLLLRTDTNMVTVPGDAVERGAKGLYAYVVKDDGKVDLRWIKVGTMGDGIAVVEDGIKDGEKVVVGGQYRLQPGASVEVRTADAAPNQGDQGKGATP